MPSIGPDLRRRPGILRQVRKGTDRLLKIRTVRRLIHTHRVATLRCVCCFHPWCRTVCGRRHDAGSDRTAITTTHDLFAVHPSLLGKAVLGHLVGVLFAITDAVSSEEVVLDHDDLVDCTDERDLPTEGELGVGH